MIIYEGYFNDKEISNDEIVTDIEQSTINDYNKQYSTSLRLELCFSKDTYLFNNPDVDKPSASLEEVARTVCKHFYNRITSFLDMNLYIDDYAEPVFQVQTERNEEKKVYKIDGMLIRPGMSSNGYGTREIDIDLHFNHSMKTAILVIKFFKKLVTGNLLSFKKEIPYTPICIGSDNPDNIKRNEGYDFYSISSNYFNFGYFAWDDKGLKKNAMGELVKICQYMIPSLTEKDIKKAKRELMKQ